MATITFSVTGNGTMDTEDRRAALLAIQAHTFRKGTVLPTDTNANIRASYLAVLTAHLAEYHAANVGNAKSPDAAIAAGLTEEQRAEILGAVVDRMLNKEPYAAILADVQS